MAKALSYKKSTTVTVKAAGYVDIEKGVIETEEGNVSFKDLLKDFDGKIWWIPDERKDWWRSGIKRTFWWRIDWSEDLSVLILNKN